MKSIIHIIIIMFLLFSILLPTFIDGFSSIIGPPPTSVKVDDTARKNGFYKWQGQDIFYEVGKSIDTDTDDGKKKPTCILLHGFGASTTYWRETMSVLQNEGYSVHALDLLGQGRSSKPFVSDEADRKSPDDTDTNMGKNTNTKVEYSINLWAKLVDDYARHNQLEDVVLMGNSLGSLVALSAATGDHSSDGDGVFLQSRVKGICLFNCAGKKRHFLDLTAYHSCCPLSY